MNTCRTAVPRSDQPGLDPAALVDAVRGDLAHAFDATECAEDEIDRATRRHPTAADLLYHAFTLIRPRDLGPRIVEFVYRSHAAELLDRLAGGQDTREPTAAEMCLTCCEISQRVPLRGRPSASICGCGHGRFPASPPPPTRPSSCTRTNSCTVRRSTTSKRNCAAGCATRGADCRQSTARAATTAGRCGAGMPPGAEVAAGDGGVP
jgi:hypothetical protein